MVNCMIVYIDMYMDACMSVHTDMRTNLYIDMCMGVCEDMHKDMGADMCTDMYTGMCMARAHCHELDILRNEQREATAAAVEPETRPFSHSRGRRAIAVGVEP